MRAKRKHTRIVVELRTAVLGLAVEKAAQQGRSLGKILIDAVMATYGAPAARARRIPHLPVSGRGGLRPGIDIDKLR